MYITYQDGTNSIDTTYNTKYGYSIGSYTMWPRYPNNSNIYVYNDFYETRLTEYKRENVMKLYEIIAVDKKECEILKTQKLIAKDRETAMLGLELTPEIREKVKKGNVEFIFNELGSFEKVEKTIVVKDFVEE